MMDDIQKVAEDLQECKTEVGQQVEALRTDLQKLKRDVEELLEIFRASKGFIRVLAWLGVAIKWSVATGLGVLIIWHFIKTGEWK